MSSDTFYLCHLLDDDDGRLDSEEVWDAASAEEAAKTAASYMHYVDPTNKRMAVYGPFDASVATQTFRIRYDDYEDDFTVEHQP